MPYFTSASGAVPTAAIAESELGWADYVDTTYSSGSPLAISADTDTVLTNNAGTIRNTYAPADIGAMYSEGKIVGRTGEAIGITLDFTAVPTNANTTLIETWIDIGSPVGQLYRRPYSFPKGQGVARQIISSTIAYTLDTWETNGGTVYVRANNTCDIYDIRFVIFRMSKV